MANLNARQINFLTKLKTFAEDIKKLYGTAHDIAESYDEEFSNAQDNDLSTADNLEDVYNFDSGDVSAAVNQAVDNFINFWIGNAVTTREYGKDLRRIK